MNIKKLLLNTLNNPKILNLVPDKRVYFLHANNPIPPYIEYQVILEDDIEYSEGKAQFTNYIVQVDIFSRGDYTELEEIIKKVMLEAGFEKNSSCPDLYEEKTKLNHKPIRFNIDLPTS